MAGGVMVPSGPSVREVPDVTMGDNFGRVAAVYESLRTTDEAPVRAIGQFLPDRPVTGLDVGLRDGTVLAAAGRAAAGRVAAGRNRRLGGHAGPAHRRHPRPRPAGGAAARRRRRAAVAGRQPGPGHRVQLRSPLRSRPLPDRRRPGAAARRPAVHLRPHPAAERANDLGPLLPGLHQHEQRLHSQAALLDAVRRTGGLTVAATQTFQQPRSSTAERLAGPGRGTPLLDVLPLPAAGAERVHRATSLAHLPGPEVSWVDEHLLVIAGASRPGQAEPDGPASPASQPIKDHAPRSAPGTSEAPKRHPGGRAQITPLCAQWIAGQHRQQSAQNAFGQDTRQVLMLQAMYQVTHQRRVYKEFFYQLIEYLDAKWADGLGIDGPEFIRHIHQMADDDLDALGVRDGDGPRHRDRGSALRVQPPRLQAVVAAARSRGDRLRDCPSSELPDSVSPTGHPSSTSSHRTSPRAETG